MNRQDLAVLWLTDRALSLREVALKMEGAYTKESPLGQMAHRVAEHYRKAAQYLESAARAERDVAPTDG